MKQLKSVKSKRNLIKALIKRNTLFPANAERI